MKRFLLVCALLFSSLTYSQIFNFSSGKIDLIDSKTFKSTYYGDVIKLVYNEKYNSISFAYRSDIGIGTLHLVYSDKKKGEELFIDKQTNTYYYIENCILDLGYMNIKTYDRKTIWKVYNLKE